MSLDRETYDPYKDYGPYQEIHQRMNQAFEEAGSDPKSEWYGTPGPPPVLDWTEIDPLAEKMANTLFARVGPLDKDREAQGLAMHTIRKGYRFYVESKELGGETITVEPFGAQRSSANPCLWVIIDRDPRALIEVTPDKDHNAIAQHYLSGYSHCDIEVSYSCETKMATEILSIKSGEFICVYKACTACSAWFYEPDREQFRKWTFFDGFDEEFSDRL